MSKLKLFSAAATTRHVMTAIAAVVLLAATAGLLFATYLPGPGAAFVNRLDEGWSRHSGDGWTPIETLPCTLEANGEALLLRHSLEGMDFHKEYVLTLRTRYASIRAWADGELVYEAAQGEEHALGSMWHFIPASELMGAEAVTVELRTYGVSDYELESVLFDSPGAVRYALLRDNVQAIVFSSICAMLAVVMLLGALVLARWKSPSSTPLFILAVFMLLSGSWILLDSKVTTLGGGNYALSYFLSYAAFYLLAVPYLLYVRVMLSDCKRVLNALIWAMLINAALCFSLHMLGLVELRSTAISVHVLIILSVPVCIFAFWRSVVQRREKQLRFSFIGVVAVFACGIASIALYYTGGLKSANSTWLYIIGLSLMLAGMTTDAVAAFGRFWRLKDSSDRYRRLAIEDSMTGLGNRNAFQLRMAALVQKPPERMAFIAFDIDDLKRINDRLGHHVGDQAIYTAALCIRGAFEGFGDCYRIGGDEFAVLITGRAVGRIPELEARFHREVERHWSQTFPSGGISIGWASGTYTDGRAFTADSISQLRANADQALYLDKQRRKTGRAEGPAVV